MNYQVVSKHVPPTLTLTHTSPCTFQNLKQIIYSIYDEVKKNKKSSFICLTNEKDLKSDSPLSIYCPVHDSFSPFNEKKFCYEVLQRTKVLSTIHAGGYDQLDLAFEALFAQAEKDDLEVLPQYRIVFHKEKRKWQRKRFFKRPEVDYLTEIQIQVAPKNK